MLQNIGDSEVAHLMVSMARVDPQQLENVLRIITERNPQPTELLEILGSELSYTEIQDAVGELLDAGTVELGADRRLRAVQSVAAD